MRPFTPHVLLAALLLATVGAATPAAAQQQIGYVDTEYLIDQLPEYATAQQRIDQLSERWETEIQEQEAEVEELVEEFQARRLLYTDEERQQQQQQIEQARQQVNDLRQQYFGPQGQLYSRQQDLIRPIQERVLTAVEAVARGEGYDYIFDKSGQMLMLYADDDHDLNAAVLEELGIDIDRSSAENE